MTMKISPNRNAIKKCSTSHKYQSRLDIRISSGFLCLNEGGESNGRLT